VEIYQVNPKDVEICRPVSARDIKHQMVRLSEEGQIEPIVVEELERDGQLKVRDLLDDWIYASAQVIAARELEWETILVTY
jgi:hypothetical protein